jgi:hypothetical protein
VTFLNNSGKGQTELSGSQRGATYHAALGTVKCTSHRDNLIYSVSQDERSIFWEITVSAILRKKVYMSMCPIPVSEIELFEYTVAKLLIKKEILRSF